MKRHDETDEMKELKKQRNRIRKEIEKKERELAKMIGEFVTDWLKSDIEKLQQDLIKVDKQLQELYS